jgi:hypothetical protein
MKETAPLLGLIFCISISPRVWTVFICLLFFAVLWACLWLPARKLSFFYFDAQDFKNSDAGTSRRLPLSASTGTFAPFLKGYVGAVKLLITVAAASIAFGADKDVKLWILLAKIILAFSILYGTLFVGLLQFFYEEYAQNLQAYRPWRYTLIQALGFSALACFVAGFFIWAFNL